MATVRNYSAIVDLHPIELLQMALPKLMPKSLEQDVVSKIDWAQFDRKSTRLGTFLKEQLGDRCPKSLVANSGTLETQRKVDLARLVAKHAEWNNIGEAAQALAKAVYDFIAHHNPP